MRRLVVLLLLIVVGAAAASPTPGGYASSPVVRTFYVASNGSDAAAGTQLAPWATIDHARSYIRANSVNTGMTTFVDVSIAAGDYWLASKVTWTDADSGSNGWDVRYRCSGAVGTCKHYGGVKLDTSTCVVSSGSTYKCPLAGPIIGTMWEGGVRGIEARTPALVPDGSFPLSQAPYLHTAGVEGSATVLQYTPGDLTPGAWDLSSAGIRLWPNFIANVENDWFTDWLPIQSVNTGAKQLTLATASFGFAYQSHSARYFAVGDLSMLVGAGQFYHDVTNGFLYYWPRNTPITSQTIVVPTLDTVFEVVGASSGAPAHNIVFDGLDAEITNFPHTWRAGTLQIGDHLTAGIYVTNAKNIQVLNCNVHDVGTRGIFFHSAVQDSRIEKTSVHGTGSDGILFENALGVSPDLGNVSTRNIITNDKIVSVGELVGEAAGLFFLNVSNSTIEYVNAHDGTRAGIELIGRFAQDGASKSYAVGNLVQFVKLANFGQDSGDIGAIYIGQTGNVGSPQVNTFQQFTVDNSKANASMLDAAPNGVFMDDNSFQQIFKNANVTNSGGTDFRENNSDNGVTTNVSWTGGFSAALVDTWNIGTKGNFPY
jgi:hypothetical protein